MAKIPGAELNRRLEEIARFLAAGHTDEQIMNNLHLKRRTFYYYKARVFKIYNDIAAKKTEQVLPLEAEILKDRYIRLFRTLEQRITTTKREELHGATNAAEVAAMIATDIFRLEVESFRFGKHLAEAKSSESR